MNKLIDTFSEYYFELYESARSNSGIADEQLQRVLNTHSEIRQVSKNSADLPKPLVNLFVDMQAALMSCAARHPQDMARKINLAADKLAALAREIAS